MVDPAAGLDSDNRTDTDNHDTDVGLDGLAVAPPAPGSWRAAAKTGGGWADLSAHWRMACRLAHQEQLGRTKSSWHVTSQPKQHAETQAQDPPTGAPSNISRAKCFDAIGRTPGSSLGIF